jgi:hypothetical protein
MQIAPVLSTDIVNQSNDYHAEAKQYKKTKK